MTIRSRSSQQELCFGQRRIPDLLTYGRPAMSHERPLQGACSCGRNGYLILVPENATEKAQVYFDVSSENRMIRTDLLQRPSLLTLLFRTFASCAFDCVATSADLVVSIVHSILLPRRNALRHPAHVHTASCTILQTKFLWLLRYAPNILE
jgi:hypothetical protein